MDIGLYRFGGSAIRIGEVVDFKDSVDAQGKPVVYVHYRGRQCVAFDGPDADRIRAFVAALPEPEIEVKPGSRDRVARVIPSLDPETGLEITDRASQDIS